MRSGRHYAALGLAACLALLALCGTAQPGAAAPSAAPMLMITTPNPQNLRFCLGEQICEVGDVNGDTQADLIVFVRSTLGRARAGEVWVALHTSSGFAEPSLWRTALCQGNEDCTVGDMDADGMADLVAFLKDTHGDDQLGQVLVARSTGSSFGEPASALYEKSGQQPQRLIFCIGSEICRVGDLNGDGWADLIAFARSAYPNRPGYVWYAQRLPTFDNAPIFADPSVLKTEFCKNEAECTLGDVDANSRAELISFLRQTSPGDASSHVQVYFPSDLTKTDSGSVQTWHEAFCLLNERCMVGDIDGPIVYGPKPLKKRVDLVAFSSQQAEDGTLTYSMKIALASGQKFTDPPLEFQGDYCPGNDICRIADIDGNGQDDVIAFDRSASPRECASNVRVSFAWSQPASPPPGRSYERSRPTQAAGTSALQLPHKTHLPVIATYTPIYCLP